MPGARRSSPCRHGPALIDGPRRAHDVACRCAAGLARAVAARTRAVADRRGRTAGDRIAGADPGTGHRAVRCLRCVVAGVEPHRPAGAGGVSRGELDAAGAAAPAADLGAGRCGPGRRRAWRGRALGACPPTQRCLAGALAAGGRAGGAATPSIRSAGRLAGGRVRTLGGGGGVAAPASRQWTVPAPASHRRHRQQMDRTASRRHRRLACRPARHRRAAQLCQPVRPAQRAGSGALAIARPGPAPPHRRPGGHHRTDRADRRAASACAPRADRGKTAKPVWPANRCRARWC